MKLEALHPNDPTSIYVASVARIFDNYYFLVKVDNLLSTQDDLILNSFVAHRNSPCIFPIGFCTRNGVTLHQPKGKGLFSLRSLPPLQTVIFLLCKFSMKNVVVYFSKL